MVAGFDRYFQIAPCFRDEAGRADRTLMFYQLDLEMSFVTQDDVFAAVEPVMEGVFRDFANGKSVDAAPFRRIPYLQAMLDYGSDKPDLRNPLIISDVTEAFAGSGFGLFARIAASGGVVRAIPAPGAGGKPRGFFDKLNEWARQEGAGGLGYIAFDGADAKGPIAKNLEPERLEMPFAQQLGPRGWRRGVLRARPAGRTMHRSFAGEARTKARPPSSTSIEHRTAYRVLLDRRLPVLRAGARKKSARSTSCPQPIQQCRQGGMTSLKDGTDPLTIKAYQYDAVCNGFEMSLRLDP